MAVKEGRTYGDLTAKWSWNSRGGRVWKCVCKRCGTTYYIREQGILSGMVAKCQCREDDEEAS